MKEVHTRSIYAQRKIFACINYNNDVFMKQWQKVWLYFIISFAFIHLIRDIFQDLGIKNLLSTILVKPNPLKGSILWVIFNTYILEIGALFVAFYLLARNKFGFLGYLTIIGSTLTVSFWIYWYILL